MVRLPWSPGRIVGWARCSPGSWSDEGAKVYGVARHPGVVNGPA